MTAWAPRILREAPQPHRALDVAMGRGRHAVALARAGFRAFGVDRNLDALEAASTAARTAGVLVRAWCADLTAYPLPRAAFELVVVSRYLDRDLFPALRETVVRGGFVIYETFTRAQLAHGTGPRSPAHLLEPGELRRRFEGFDVWFYEEVTEPEALARLVARRACP